MMARQVQTLDCLRTAPWQPKCGLPKSEIRGRSDIGLILAPSSRNLNTLPLNINHSAPMYDIKIGEGFTGRICIAKCCRKSMVLQCECSKLVGVTDAGIEVQNKVSYTGANGREIV